MSHGTSVIWGVEKGKEGREKDERGKGEGQAGGKKGRPRDLGEYSCVTDTLYRVPRLLKSCDVITQGECLCISLVQQGLQ